MYVLNNSIEIGKIDASKMGKKVLYTGEPSVKFNQIESSVLSIVDKEKDYEIWFNNNFIQLIVSENAHWGAFLFANNVVYDCPWLNMAKLDHKMIVGDIVSYLKGKLEHDVYIWMNIEIINIPIYNLSVNYHDVFIYGYDDSKKIFYCADFFEGGHYQRNTITYESILKGYNNMRNYHETLGVVLIWKKKHTIYKNKYTNSVEIIRNGIRNYLLGIYPFGKHEYMERSDLHSHKYGIEIYQVLINYCESLINGSDKYLDYRMFDMLYQHKKIMSVRVLYMIKKGYMHDDILEEHIKKIEKKALIIRNLFIKYTIKIEHNKLLQLIEKLVELQKYESYCYEKILNIV